MNLFGALAKVEHRLVSPHELLFEVCKDIRLRSYAHSYGDTWPAAVGDAYDEHAIHFLASINGKPLATARMLTHDNKFEVEEHGPLTEFRKQGVCAEVGRFAVDPNARNSVLSFAMFHAFYRIWAQQHTRFIFCGISDNSPMATIVNTLAFVALPIRYRNSIFNVDVTVNMLDLPECEQRVNDRQAQFIKIFHQPINGIG